MIDKNEALETARHLTQYAPTVAAAMYRGEEMSGIWQMRNAARLLRAAVGTVACAVCEGTGLDRPNLHAAPCGRCMGLGAVESPAYTTSGQEVLYRGEHYCDARDNAAADFIAAKLNGEG